MARLRGRALACVAALFAAIWVSAAAPVPENADSYVLLDVGALLESDLFARFTEVWGGKVVFVDLLRTEAARLGVDIEELAPDIAAVINWKQLERTVIAAEFSRPIRGAVMTAALAQPELFKVDEAGAIRARFDINEGKVGKEPLFYEIRFVRDDLAVGGESTAVAGYLADIQAGVKAVEGTGAVARCVLRLPAKTGSQAADLLIGGIGAVDANIFAGEGGGARLESTWHGADSRELRQRLGMVWNFGAGLLFGRDKALADRLKGLPAIRNRGAGVVEFTVTLGTEEIDRMLAILQESIRKDSVYFVNTNEEEGW